MSHENTDSRPPLPPPGPPLEHLDSGSTVNERNEVIEVLPRPQVGDLNTQEVVVLCPQRAYPRNHK
jgi:hypothetical protein